MTATEQGGRGWPPAAAVPDWPGRPTVDVPGLDRPARYCHAVATLDDIGRRQFLVIASEDGALPTTEQITALADGLDELHGDDAPVGSRAWLRDQLAKHRAEIDRMVRHETTWRNRAELAEAALRDRSTVDPDGRERERLSLDLAHTRDAHTAQAARATQLYREREEARADLRELGQRLAASAEEVSGLRAELHRARTAAIEQRDGALTDALDQTSRLRKANRAASDEVMGMRNQIRELEEQRAELRDALVDTLRQLARRTTSQLDAERQAATQTRRARSAATSAAGALLATAAAAAITAWRRTR